MKLILFFVVLSGTYSLSFSMEDQCLICLGSLILEPHLKLNCAHSYHQQCWTEWEFEENTRIISFQTIGGEQFDDTEDPLEVQEIPGIRCPLCNCTVDENEIIYDQAVYSEVIKRRVLDKLAGIVSLVRNSGTMKVDFGVQKN